MYYINPTVGLRNKHILPYFLCEYEENDLILATPLCEYNIGQYVLLLKENAEKNIFNLNQMEIVRQFLNGLAFLHQRLEPIVHGNLKPSNIFVDIHGVVRLAEFGINKVNIKKYCNIFSAIHLTEFSRYGCWKLLENSS